MNPSTTLPPNKIEQFRTFWKTRVENDLGIGTWCKTDKKPEIKISRYTKLLENAQNRKSDIKFTGKFTPGGQFSIREIWLEAIEIPWSLKIIQPKEKPDSEENSNSTTLTIPKPTTQSNLNFTPSTEHKCPWIELPQVEAKYQQQYQAELDLLRTSELNLTTEKNKLSQELQETKQEAQDICSHWGVGDLDQLSQKLTSEIRNKNTYLDEKNYAQQEITRLQNENQDCKSKLIWWKNETNAIANQLNIKSREELNQLLKGQNLQQIVQAREKAERKEKSTQIAHQQLALRHQVSTLAELSEKLTTTEQLLKQEKDWWNKWFAEPSQLTINILKRDGNQSNYALEIWEQTDSFDLEEQPNSKKGRKNIQAIYKHYINNPTAEETSLTELDNKIGFLIGIDYSLQQIADLRKSFINNNLPNTYLFIEEITSLTNNHKIKQLESKSEELKNNLDENTEEELKAKINTLAPLLDACALLETKEFIKLGFEEWTKLLEKVEEI